MPKTSASRSMDKVFFSAKIQVMSWDMKWYSQQVTISWSKTQAGSLLSISNAHVLHISLQGELFIKHITQPVLMILQSSFSAHFIHEWSQLLVFLHFSLDYLSNEIWLLVNFLVIYWQFVKTITDRSRISTPHLCRWIVSTTL